MASTTMDVGTVSNATMDPITATTTSISTTTNVSGIGTPRDTETSTNQVIIHNIEDRCHLVFNICGFTSMALSITVVDIIYLFSLTDSSFNLSTVDISIDIASAIYTVYFVIDTIWLFVHPNSFLGKKNWTKIEFLIILIHHIVCIFNVYLSYYQWQFSNPKNILSFLHNPKLNKNTKYMRRLYHQTLVVPTLALHCEWNTLFRDLKRLFLNYKNKKWYKIISILFDITWFTNRVVLLPIVQGLLIYCAIILEPGSGLTVTYVTLNTVNGLLLILQYYWSLKWWKGVKRRYGFERVI